MKGKSGGAGRRLGAKEKGPKERQGGTEQTGRDVNGGVRGQSFGALGHGGCMLYCGQH